MPFTPSEIVAGLVASAAVIGGLVKAFNTITSRLDERRKRITDERLKEITSAVELRRLQIESDGKINDTLLANLWKLIETKDAEIAGLEAEVAECEKKATLDRPTINKLRVNLRAMRKEMDSLNVMVLNEEETKVFMRRFSAVKALLEEAENTLP